MTDITVAIPLTADTDLCREAVASVLTQQGIEVEILLLTTDTGMAAAVSTDPRAGSLPLRHQPGLTESLDLLAANSSATFVMYLLPHKRLLPGALAMLIEAMNEHDGTDMAYALEFATDERGNISREVYHKLWERAHNLRSFDAGSLQQLLRTDFLLTGIKLYRRHSLISKLSLSGRSRWDYSPTWFIHANLEVRLLSRPVCIDKGSLPRRDRRSIRPIDYLCRVATLLFRAEPPADGHGTVEIVWAAIKHYWIGSRPYWFFQRWRNRLHRGFRVSGLADFFYRQIVALMSRVSPDPAPAAANMRVGAGTVGYYLWRYPVLSQTFVQREVAALCRNGADIVVISDTEPDDGFIDELAPVLASSAATMPVLDKDKLKALRRSFFRRNPWRYLRLFLFVMSRRYHQIKDLTFDQQVFNTAIKLAAQVEQRGIRHLHSPWADNCAFIALIAARLAGIPYSVQARAHDIHRHSYCFGLREKFENAAFIVTNTQYNVNAIGNLLPDDQADKVKHIYNGLNLEQFEPRNHSTTGHGKVRLLCVARLIEQKGLTYLLRACRALLDQGHNIHCDIVGGVEDLFMNYYIELKRLHQSLRLERYVHFAGSVPFDEVLDYQHKADIFVLPCVIAEDGSRDIIPNSVLEAMAMRLPVVSTTVTALPEMVDHGTTGYLVPPGELDPMVEAIGQLVKSPKLRKTFGTAGRARAEKLFDSSKNVQDYQRLFYPVPVTSQPVSATEGIPAAEECHRRL